MNPFDTMQKTEHPDSFRQRCYGIVYKGYHGYVNVYASKEARQDTSGNSKPLKTIPLSEYKRHVWWLQESQSIMESATHSDTENGQEEP